MANVLSSNPAIFDTSTTFAGNTNWKGSSGGSKYTGGIGIRPCKIILTPTTGATVAGAVVINEVNKDGSTGPVLFQAQVATLGATATSAQEFDFVGASPGWHDFIVTLNGTGVTLELYYRV